MDDSQGVKLNFMRRWRIIPIITLTVEDELFKHLDLQTKKHKFCVNNEIISIEDIFFSVVRNDPRPH
jgi:hypothetical protein